MNIEFMSYKSAVKAILNSNSLFGFTTTSVLLASACCREQKESFLFLNKLVKSEQQLGYVHNIGEWETCRKRYNLFSLFSITTKKSSILNMLTRAQEYECFFRSQNGC